MMTKFGGGFFRQRRSRDWCEEVDVVEVIERKRIALVSRLGSHSRSHSRSHSHSNLIDPIMPRGPVISHSAHTTQR